MTPGAAKQDSKPRWRPHPDDENEVGTAVESVERGELLSPEASDAFLRWLEGSSDDSWHVEFE
jgi:hypothetical protein